MNGDYKRDLAYDPLKPPCVECGAESLMKWHGKELCESCYRAVLPQVLREIREQQLVLGGLRKKERR